MNKLRISIGKILFLLVVTFFLSCNKNKHEVDISGIKLDLKYHRFDKILFNTELDRLNDHVLMLEKEHGSFFELYNNKVITIGSSSQRSYAEYLKGFLTDFTINEVYKKCSDEFADDSWLKEDFTQAFKHYKYYFPGKPVPEVYCYLSGFNQSVVTAENILGIGLDKYLGSNCDFYKRLALPVFLRYKMHKKKIVSDAMYAFAMAEFPFKTDNENLVNSMLYQGKMMYFLDAVLPYEHDSVKFGFTSRQLTWCQNSEREMWSYLVNKKQLFLSDFMTIKKYVDDAPFTPNFSRNSPGRAVVWLGRQIINEYMRRKPEITLSQLMAENDYQKILATARYKP